MGCCCNLNLTGSLDTMDWWLLELVRKKSGILDLVLDLFWRLMEWRVEL